MISVDKRDFNASPEAIRTAEAALQQICDYIDRHKMLASDTRHAEQLRDALQNAMIEPYFSEKAFYLEGR